MIHASSHLNHCCNSNPPPPPPPLPAHSCIMDPNSGNSRISKNMLFCILGCSKCLTLNALRAAHYSGVSQALLFHYVLSSLMCRTSSAHPFYSKPQISTSPHFQRSFLSSRKVSSFSSAMLRSFPLCNPPCLIHKPALGYKSHLPREWNGIDSQCQSRYGSHHQPDLLHLSSHQFALFWVGRPV